MYKRYIGLCPHCGSQVGLYNENEVCMKCGRSFSRDILMESFEQNDERHRVEDIQKSKEIISTNSHNS